MELFATYCSANKDPAPHDLPAVDRYVSDRIAGVCANASTAGARFGILSGRFGLIAPSTPIPDYDHLLQASEVDAMAERVAEILRQWNIESVRWFSVAFEMDPHVSRYSDTMSQAAEKAGADFDLELWEPTGMLGLI